MRFFFLSIIILVLLGGSYPAQAVDTISFEKIDLEKISQGDILLVISNFIQELPSSLSAALIQTPQSPSLTAPLGVKNLSYFNPAQRKIYVRPWETNGLVECEPWGPGKGRSICVAGVQPSDPPCPIFQDCDGDGHYWWKGEDCDENCPTCYVGSPYTTSQPDGRDQDCDGIVDDQIECIPVYGSRKYFGYDSNCNWTYNTLNILVNEGEMGEIPTDELHCKKIFGQCTSAVGGWGNCVVSKTPGYFVKSSGINCGGGVWRAKTSDALFYCGKALRNSSYKGYYGCGLDCCRQRIVCHSTDHGQVCRCEGPCLCISSPCPVCYPCTPKPQPYDACNPGGCPLNSAFDYPSSTNYGPWALCHGYNTISCQVMTGCKRIFTLNYH